MKKCTLLAAALIIVTASFGNNLTVRATGVKGSGQVHFVLFNNSQGFPDEARHSLVASRVNAENGHAVWTLFLPADKRYAVAAFYDVNGNGRLDRNLFGAPTEPYGFSGDVRPMFRAPSFQEAAFKLSTAGEIRIKLK